MNNRDGLETFVDIVNGETGQAIFEKNIKDYTMKLM